MKFMVDIITYVIYHTNDNDPDDFLVFWSTCLCGK